MYKSLYIDSHHYYPQLSDNIAIINDCLIMTIHHIQLAILPIFNHNLQANLSHNYHQCNHDHQWYNNGNAGNNSAVAIVMFTEPMISIISGVFRFNLGPFLPHAMAPTCAAGACAYRCRLGAAMALPRWWEMWESPWCGLFPWLPWPVMAIQMSVLGISRRSVSQAERDYV